MRTAKEDPTTRTGGGEDRATHLDAPHTRRGPTGRQAGHLIGDKANMRTQGEEKGARKDVTEAGTAGETAGMVGDQNPVIEDEIGACRQTTKRGARHHTQKRTI